MKNVRGGRFFFNIYFVIIIILAGLLIWAAAPALGNFSRRIAADFFHPYLAAAASVQGAIADRTLLAQDKETLAAALENTREELAQALAASARFDAVKKENNELRALLQLEPRVNYRYVAGEVEQFDPLYWKKRFRLNRGSDSGIIPGCAVIALIDNNKQNYAVVAGFVRSVSQHSSEVITLHNPELRMPVKLVDANAVGYINGENLPAPLEDLASISYLPLQNQYRIGDSAVTTDFDPIVPAGLKLGELAIMDSDNPVFSSMLYRRGYLRPALSNPDEANFMLIIVPENTGEQKP